MAKLTHVSHINKCSIAFHERDINLASTQDKAGLSACNFKGRSTYILLKTKVFKTNSADNENGNAANKI